MKNGSLTVDLFAELKAIQRGGCVWCERGTSHPAYSRCARHRARANVDQMARTLPVTVRELSFATARA